MGRQQAVVSSTHPTTLETYHLRLSTTGAGHVAQALHDMGYWGVMQTTEEYFDSPDFEDPWAALRAKGEVKTQ
tara:strand:- start:56 stop:274 length:219 start_codon:yes stop_codon:yes gene_type:complete